MANSKNLGKASISISINDGQIVVEHSDGTLLKVINNPIPDAWHTLWLAIDSLDTQNIQTKSKK